MMHKLYWKIFIWFWLAMCLTIVIIALVSSQVTQKSSSNDDEGKFISSISRSAMIMINSGNKEQFIEWKAYLKERYHIQLILLPVFPDNLHEIEAEFSPIINKVQEIQSNDQELIYPPFVVSPSFISQDGLSYRLIAKLPEEFFERYSFNRGNILFRFSVAILISGFICYLLSLYLLRPIRVLQRAARKLGQGEFQIRVSQTLSHRNDEIGELAHDFDEMAARLESLMYSKQQLLQDVSHELRSPLARLSVALEIAKDKSPCIEKELTRIEYEADKLNQLIRQILSLSALDARKGEIHFEYMDLVSILHSIMNDANYEAQDRSSLINLSAPKECFMFMNSSLLRSAIENIIRNALLYTPKHESIFVILQEKKEHLHLTIEDGGPGVSNDKLPYIFEPFFREDNSRTQKTGGFGLGLAIAKRAVELHGGNIFAKNREKQGLMVLIILPKKQP